MRGWFPFANYDFYAYLASGMLVVAAADRVFFNSMLAQQTEWSLAQGAFWTSMAYLTGHVVAIPSSALWEQIIARKMLKSPASVLLGTRPYRTAEKLTSAIFGAREYQPFPSQIRTLIRAKIANRLQVPEDRIDAEAAFQLALPHARSISDSAIRLDNFLNQYGMSRNVSFASAIAAALLFFRFSQTHAQLDAALAIGALVMAVGMFGRFVKFYAAYAREVFRTFSMIEQ